MPTIKYGTSIMPGVSYLTLSRPQGYSPMVKKLNPGTSMPDVRKGFEALNAFWKTGYMSDYMCKSYCRIIL
jgi:hypothetical protein